MHAMIRITLAAAVLSVLSACASPRYIISTHSGTLIQASGEPKLNKNTGMYEYRDADGNKGSIKQDEVTQIVKR